MNIRAYIIEDNPIIRDNLMDTLKELVQIEAVGTADNERDAAGWLCGNDNRWDLAIVDIFLKQGNGLNVLAACNQRDPGKKMVVLSNHATAEIRRRCKLLGADAVFDKSTEIDALLDYCQAEQDKSRVS